MVTPLAYVPSATQPDACDRIGDRPRSRRPDDLERMLGVGVTVSVAAGQTIVIEGDPLRYGYRILKGSVRLFKGIPDGRRQVIGFLGPDECFGLFGSQRFSYCAEAVVPTTLVRFPRDRLESALASDRQGAWSLFDQACAEFDRMQGQMLLLGRKNADEKVASFLLEQARKDGQPYQPGEVIHLPMSRQDMADYLGLTVETVSRTLSRLRQRGLIALRTPQQVILRQPHALRAIAEASA